MAADDIQLTPLRALDLEGGYLSAASGLVRVGTELYVVADDELHLGRFDAAGAKPGALLRLFDGELPSGARQRKRAKPDLEIILKLPPTAVAPGGSVLVLGSGSGSLRRRGALLHFDAGWQLIDSPRAIDASRLFAQLGQYFEDLNLEGGWVHGTALHLLQRGHRRNPANVVIAIELQQVLQCLTAGAAAPVPLALHAMTLGEYKGVPLCFSDACALEDGRWLFTAVAEDTGSSYDDGGFVGASIGLADARMQPLWMRPVAPVVKVEGIEVVERAGRLQLLLVTDADDPAIPATLYSASAG